MLIRFPVWLFFVCSVIEFLDLDLGRLFKTLSGNETVTKLVLDDCTGFLKSKNRATMHGARPKTVMIDGGKSTSTSKLLMVEGCCEMLESPTLVRTTNNRPCTPSRKNCRCMGPHIYLTLLISC